MKQVEKTQVKTQNKLTKKAGRVVAVAMALLVLIFALFLLLSPMKASNFFGTLGFKNWSVSMAYSAAEDSGSFDDWWSVFEKAVKADNYKIVCISSAKLQNHSDFATAIKDKKAKVNNIEQEGRYYLYYQHARCSLLESPEKIDEIWNWCEIRHEQHGWGTSLGNDTYSLNGIKGFVDAAIQNDKIPVEQVLVKLEKIYNKEGYFDDMTSTSKRKDFITCAKKLVDERESEINQETKDLWQTYYDKIF
ncbi:MAG: hypothetical protein E7344_04670 [Clostridiales bacterium]|nr:hypothetical protein [Clostridiales bacterium]